MARARKPNARVVLNRSRMTEVGLAVADGLLAAAERIVRSADPPDATPYGYGLVTQGGWIVYHGSKKVGGGSLTGRQPKKPRKVRVAGTTGITAIAGFGFPGRFQEGGTVHHAAQPFLWPAFEQVEGQVTSIVAAAARERLPRRGEP